jgi:hypothetical protein
MGTGLFVIGLAIASYYAFGYTGLVLFAFFVLGDLLNAVSEGFSALNRKLNSINEELEALSKKVDKLTKS